MQERTSALIDAYASTISPESFALAPDSQTIAFTLAQNGCSQVFTLPLTRPGLIFRVTSTLDDCTSPSWSPDSSRLAFVRGKAIWTIKADGTEPHRLSDHPAGNSEPQWSPDGTQIAFFSRRRGWDHIWTVSAGGETLTQLINGDYDAEDLTWSPDGTTIAFCAAREDDLATRGVYLVSAKGGEPSLISPRGAWCGAPHYSPDGRLLAFMSDADGWFHIYAYDTQTGESRQVTRGEFEDGGPHFYNVDTYGGPFFSPDGSRIAFVRHQEGNFDVWIHELESGREQCISEEGGHYRIIGWMVDGAHIAVAHDSLSCPSDIYLLAVTERPVRLTNSASALITGEAIFPEWVTYKARDGMIIPAAMLRPPEVEGRKFPAVLFLHGGPNFQFANYYYPLPELIAQDGFVVFAPNFRGSTGYGRAFRHANFGEWGHADAFDVIDAAKWLQEQPYIDRDRIAVVGPSYGGYLSLAVLTLAPEIFCAGIDLYGDSEIAESYRHGDRYGRMDLKRHMGTPEENPEGYRRGSPFYAAERIQAPVLLLHGRNDRLVVPLMSEKMIEALRIENKYFESHFYKGEEHGFSKSENKQDAWQRVLRFLNQHCRDKP